MAKVGVKDSTAFKFADPRDGHLSLNIDVIEVKLQRCLPLENVRIRWLVHVKTDKDTELAVADETLGLVLV